MRELGLQDVIRGKPVKTTISDKASPCPLDQVNRARRQLLFLQVLLGKRRSSSLTSSHVSGRICRPLN